MFPKENLPPPAPINPNFTPTCSITSLPPGSTFNEVLAILERDGGVILEDLVSTDELERIDDEICEASRGQYVDETNQASYITPRETILVPGLVGKSSTAAKICERPILRKLQDYVLAERYTTICEDLVKEESIDPLLSASMSFNIGPGAPRQRLHRDDHIFGMKHDRSNGYDLKKESMFAVLVAGCHTKRETGATMFIPGSHKWDDERAPKLEEICFAGTLLPNFSIPSPTICETIINVQKEMKPGSALVFLASSYHGGGQNSSKDFRRIVHGLFFIRGNLRQEENQFLAVPRSKVLKMSTKMKSLLGYKQPGTVLGIVDNKCPLVGLEQVLARAAR